jgi:hypothetical protein
MGGEAETELAEKKPRISRARKSVNVEDIKFDLHDPLEIDGDEAELMNNGYIIMSVNKLKSLEGNWQEDEGGISYFSALFSCKLRPNDVHFALSFAIAVISWIIMLVGLLLTTNGNLGAISCMPLIYGYVCILQIVSVVT